MTGKVVLDHYMTTDLRACEEPHLFLGVGQFSGARTDCGDKQSTELLSWDIINSINFYLEGMERGRRGWREGGGERRERRRGEEWRGGRECSMICIIHLLRLTTQYHAFC